MDEVTLAKFAQTCHTAANHTERLRFHDVKVSSLAKFEAFVTALRNKAVDSDVNPRRRGDRLRCLALSWINDYFNDAIHLRTLQWVLTVTPNLTRLVLHLPQPRLPPHAVQKVSLVFLRNLQCLTVNVEFLPFLCQSPDTLHRLTVIGAAASDTDLSTRIAAVFGGSQVQHLRILRTFARSHDYTRESPTRVIAGLAGVMKELDRLELRDVPSVRALFPSVLDSVFTISTQSSPTLRSR